MHATDRAIELDLEAADARERAARQDAKSMKQQLMRVQRLEAVGSLASGIAHDFNNLLMVVLAEAESIAETADLTEDVRESSKHILDAAERGREVTKRLLAFARQTPSSPGPVDLNALVQAMEHILATASGPRCQLLLVPAPSKVTVLADTGMLEQMILNLVLNARDAMPDGGQLSVELGSSDSFGYIRVSDTGCGIPASVLPRIFDPFFTTKEVDKGTGLGLAMVFGGVEQLGGSVDVTSTLGEGTVFTLRFKLTEAVDPTS
jgi:signal transduction histidine kinase